MNAYEAYVRKEPRSMDHLLKLVNEFAFLKVRHLEHDFKDFGSAETADDWAQEVSIKVWQNLEQFANNPASTPASFYSWVHKIAFNQATDAFNLLYEERRIKVDLTVPVRDDYGRKKDGEEEENPKIYMNGGASDIGPSIPRSAEGLDRTICNLLLTEVRGEDDRHRGRTYAEVARLLDMSVDAVEIRIRRMRDKNKANKEQEKARRKQQRLDALEEAANSVSIGLAKIRGAKP